MKILLNLLFVLPLIVNIAHAKKKFFKDTYELKISTGCKNQIPEKSFRKACKSDKYNGKKIYMCKLQCPKSEPCNGKSDKKWIVEDTRVCNQDGDRKGYYVNDCAGKALNVKSFKKACAKKAAKGESVVKCRNGKVIKRKSCASAKNNKGKYETRVFVNKCGGKVAKKNRREIRRNLGKACRTKKFEGKALVKCTNKCTDRKGVRCNKRTWIEKKKVICDGGKKSGKLKGCNEEQTRKITKAFDLGKKNISTLISKMNKWLKDPDKQFKEHANRTYSKKEKKKLIKRVKKALKRAKKIKSHISKKPTFYCHGESENCGKDLVHAFYRKKVGGKQKSYYCDRFFSDTQTVQDRSGTLIHELSHQVGTVDLTYTPSDIKNIDWWKNAKTFDSWIDYFDNEIRFCIPGWKNCF